MSRRACGSEKRRRPKIERMEDFREWDREKRSRA